MTTNHRVFRIGGTPGSIRRAALLLASLATPACASPGAAPAPAGVERPGDAASFRAPAALSITDRWYVLVNRNTGSDPLAMRTRREDLGGGLVREEVAWGRSFIAVARGETAPAGVAGLRLTRSGLETVPLDAAGRPSGAAALEVGAPFRTGTTWDASGPRRSVRGRIEGVESVATPSGAVHGALRVAHRSSTGTMTTWYDATLRPVRAEVRDSDGRLVEGRAALLDEHPRPTDCTAALHWAQVHLR